MIQQRAGAAQNWPAAVGIFVEVAQEEHMDTILCRKCNKLMDEGRLSVSDGTIGYVSTKQKGMIRQATLIHQARACPNCGYVELYLDPRALTQRLA
jgi:hypothetical protein